MVTFMNFIFSSLTNFYSMLKNIEIPFANGLSVSLFSIMLFISLDVLIYRFIYRLLNTGIGMGSRDLIKGSSKSSNTSTRKAKTK